jgi:adenylate cyclase
VLGFELTFKHQHDASMLSVERALALNPNYLDWRLGYPLVLAGHSRRAIEVLEAYMRLDPFQPPLAALLLGLAHYMLKDYSQALTLLRGYVLQVPLVPWGHLYLAMTHARLGRIEEAQAEIAEMLRIKPDITIRTAQTLTTFKQAKDGKHFYDALRKAGLPE